MQNVHTNCGWLSRTQLLQDSRAFLSTRTLHDQIFHEKTTIMSIITSSWNEITSEWELLKTICDHRVSSCVLWPGIKHEEVN